MALKSAEDYKNLAAHLSEIDADLDTFCKRYEFIKEGGLGRYPRRRICKYGKINYYFDLLMELNSEELHFEKFFPEIPYRLDLGIWVEIRGDRYWYDAVKFQNKPFSDFRDSFLTILEDEYEKLKQKSVEWIQENGTLDQN